jgi:hypothetical protein
MSHNAGLVAPLFYYVEKCGGKRQTVVSIWLCYAIHNSMNIQLIIQSTPAIFSSQSGTRDVVITVGKVRAPNAGVDCNVDNRLL